MSESNDSEKDKTVGYSRPPVATRFQKGKSGNPKGRPKGRKNVGTIFQDALHRKIGVREGDRIRSMPKIEAAIEVALNKALKGELGAFAKLMDVAAKLGIVELPPQEKNNAEHKLGMPDARQRLAELLLGDLEEPKTPKLMD